MNSAKVLKIGAVALGIAAVGAAVVGSVISLKEAKAFGEESVDQVNYVEQNNGIESDEKATEMQNDIQRHVYKVVSIAAITGFTSLSLAGLSFVAFAAAKNADEKEMAKLAVEQINNVYHATTEFTSLIQGAIWNGATDKEVSDILQSWIKTSSEQNANDSWAPISIDLLKNAVASGNFSDDRHMVELTKAFIEEVKKEA